MPKAGHMTGMDPRSRKGARLYRPAGALVKPVPPPLLRLIMVTRAEVLVLGLSAGVVGSLVGGLMLGIGLGLVVNSVHAGWVLVLPAAPVSGLLGYALARRLAKQLPEDPR